MKQPDAEPLAPIPVNPAYPLPGSIARPEYGPGEREALIDEIRQLLREKDAVLVAHYYTDEDLQNWATRVASQPWRQVHVFFKHEDEGAGPKLAARFGELLRSSGK